MVFLIGLGRSGTHLLAKIVQSAMVTDIEAQPQFGMCINAVVHQKPIAPLISLYKSKNYQHQGKYATKDHPNIWLVESLRQSILDPKFVCIERDVNQVVASSLKHDGVKRWVTDDWPPNPLSANYVDGYAELDVIERLTLRWVVNHKRIKALQNTNQGDILFVDYSDLVVNTENVVRQMERFLNVKLTIPKIWKNSLTKYLTELSELDLAKIRKVQEKHGNILQPNLEIH